MSSSFTTDESTRWLALPQPSNILLTGGTWNSSSVQILADRDLQAEATRIETELDRHATPSESTDDTTRTVRLALDRGMAPEAFSIAVTDDISIKAGSPEGVFRATRQLLHNLRAQGAVPRGLVESTPCVSERGFHLDAARKYYSPDWICNLITLLADVGVNRFQWHFSEHEGLRLQSNTSGLPHSQPAINRSEAQRIIAHAENLHVQVIPSLDMPGHMSAALSQRPDLRIEVDPGDVRNQQALDISHPEAFDFALRVIDDYLDVFPSSTHWNLGADEFVDFTRMEDYPELLAHARAQIAPDATGFDLLTGFVNQVARYLQSRGKTVRVWNDGMLRATHVELDPGVEVCWWTNWHEAMRPVGAHVEAGHNVINFNDSLFYYVLGEKAGYTYPTSERIWAADWHPGVFSSRVNRPDEISAPYTTQLLGAYFSVWSDAPEAQEQDEVAAGVAKPVSAMAERAWNAGSHLTHDEFQALHEKLKQSA